MVASSSAILIRGIRNLHYFGSFEVITFSHYSGKQILKFADVLSLKSGKASTIVFEEVEGGIHKLPKKRVTEESVCGRFSISSFLKLNPHEGTTHEGSVPHY